MSGAEHLGPYLLEVKEGVFPLGGDSLALGAFATVKRGWRVCDLGTGSGCLLLMLAAREGGLSLTGVEREERAAQWARQADCSLEELCRTAARLLRNRGRFALCHRPERLADLMCALRGSGLEPKRMRLLAHGPEHPPSCVLMEAVRRGRPGLRIEP